MSGCPYEPILTGTSYLVPWHMRRPYFHCHGRVFSSLARLKNFLLPNMNITNIKISDNKANFLYYNLFINTFILDKKILIEHFIHKNRVAHTFSPRKHSGFCTCGVRAYASVLVRPLVRYLSIKRNAKPF